MAVPRAESPPVFLKLGGSLITDKTSEESVRPSVLAHLAAEVQRARLDTPRLRLVLGHGSGSYGHVAAAKHGTRQGVYSSEAWFGFAEVSDAAARLNALVRKAMLTAGVPAITLQPSASACCSDGAIKSLAHEPVSAALAAGLVPVVYGDVAFDEVRGGTIISTEEILSALAEPLRPRLLLLAGETAGVHDAGGNVIPRLTPGNSADYAAALKGSRGTDVTGGMQTKVTSMLELVRRDPELRIRVFSGLAPGALYAALTSPEQASGTLIEAD